MTTVSICSEGGDSIVTASFIHLGPVSCCLWCGDPGHAHDGTDGGPAGKSGVLPIARGSALDGGAGGGSAGGFRQRSRLDEPRPWEEAVLHGEQGGSGPGGDADLPVGVLDVAVGGLDRDSEPPGYLFRLQASCKESEDFGLPLGETGRTIDARPGLSRSLDHHRDHLRVQTAGADLFRQLPCRFLGGELPAEWAWLAHGLEGIRGSEKAGGWRE